MARTFFTHGLRAIALSGALSLTACGGTEAPDTNASFTVLVDDVGHPMPTVATEAPAGPGNLRYATVEQARSLETALRGDVVWVHVASTDQGRAEIAVGLAIAEHASRGLPIGAPVFITADRRDDAAAAAMRFWSEGFSRVWVVVAS